MVGRRVDPAPPQPVGDHLGVEPGEAVDDARTTHARERAREPSESARGLVEADRLEPQRGAVEGTSEDGEILAQLLRQVGYDVGIGGSGGGQHPDMALRLAGEPHDAPVVWPEVVAPVRDAVGFVDDEHADAPGKLL